jgi:chromate reductase, NAD(P)H dehydrogenase (quinone)
MKVLGIAGSLRVASYNRALLRAAVSMSPRGMIIETAEFRGIPIYDGDVQALGIPQSVLDLADKIRRADGLLFVTPEYNYSVPGGLKNAIDWVSRVPDLPLSGKPAGIMGASMSTGGTIRAQLAFRHVAIYTNMLMMGRPEVQVARAQDKFDAAGTLTEQRTIDAVRTYLEALRDWILRLQGRDGG